MLLCGGGGGGAVEFIKSSRYVLGLLVPVMGGILRLLLESRAEMPAVEGRMSGEPGGLESIDLLPTKTPEPGRDLEPLPPTPPIVAVPV